MSLDYITYNHDELLPSSFIPTDPSVLQEDTDLLLPEPSEAATSTKDTREASDLDIDLLVAEQAAKCFLALALNGTECPKDPPLRGRPPSHLQEVSAGNGAVVFKIPGTGLVVKLSTGRRDNGLDLRNDGAVHRRVARSVARLGFKDVRVPNFMISIDRDYVEWFVSSSILTPHKAQFHGMQPTDLVLCELMPALPGSVREAVINGFVKPEDRDTVRGSERNRRCLVAPCLGAHGASEMESQTSLREFRLYADQMAEIGVDVKEVAEYMGRALAVLHFGAKVDGRGVRFLFGGKKDTDWLDPNAGDACLWMLHFKEAGFIPNEETFVDMAVTAFRGCGSVFPRPAVDGILTQKDQKNWEAFSEVYVAKCREICPDGDTGLAESFLFHVEELYKRDAGVDD